MPRSRASAKQAGTRFESLIANHLAEVVDDRIERRTRSGAKDRGDIGGIRHMGRRIVLELKDYGGKYLIGPWLLEAEVERVNDGALAGFVVAKRRGVADPSKQLVVGTVADFTALLTGVRADEPVPTRPEEKAS